MSLRSVVGLALSLLLLSACDSAPGLPEPSGRAPIVERLALTPDAVRRDTINSDWIDGATARIPITVSVHAHDEDGEIVEVQAVVLAPTNSLQPVVSTTLIRVPGDATKFSATFLLPLLLQQPGVYAVVVVARDRAGQTGQVLGSFTYTQVNDPPVIEAVAANPNPFPAAGGTLVLTAKVSDPQGLEDVLRVAVTTPYGESFRLFDNGTFGDRTPGDGIFTATFEIPEGATEDDLTFVFRASDRSGLQSAPVTLVLPVE